MLFADYTSRDFKGAKIAVDDFVNKYRQLNIRTWLAKSPLLC
jgi:hypothetical protein